MRCFWIFLFALTLSAAPERAPLNLWSGRETVLPGTGAWRVTAEHGRILASGNDEARFEIPSLADGTTLDAVLTRNGEAQRLRFHSPKPLTGFAVTVDSESPGLVRRLHSCGMGFLAELPEMRKNNFYITGKWNPAFRSNRMLVFPDRCDFPLKLAKDWDEILLCRVKNPGRLGVIYNKREGILDLDGDFTYAVLRRNEKKIVVFSPEFDLEQIENILLIKQLIKEKKR